MSKGVLLLVVVFDCEFEFWVEMRADGSVRRAFLHFKVRVGLDAHQTSWPW